MKTKRTLTVTATVVVAGAVLAGCSTYAPADSIILYYTAGAGEAKQFSQCIEPGRSGDFPVDDEIFQIPTSLRTWNIRTEGGDTDKPIKSGTLPIKVPTTADPNGPAIDQPGPEVAVYATADFYINTDCKDGANSPIVKFWENTGRRYGISSDGENGFNPESFKDMLLDTLVPAEEKAIREETRKYTGDDLDANIGGVWAKMERNLFPSFVAELRNKLGGDYFCGIGYNRGQEVSWKEWQVEKDGQGKPKTDAQGEPVMVEVDKKGTCPPVRITITDVNFADPAIQQARTNVFTARQNAESARINAESQRTQAKILEEVAKAPGYLELQKLDVERQRIDSQKAATEACRHSPSCTVIVDQSGNGVTMGVK